MEAQKGGRRGGLEAGWFLIHRQTADRRRRARGWSCGYRRGNYRVGGWRCRCQGGGGGGRGGGIKVFFKAQTIVLSLVCIVPSIERNKVFGIHGIRVIGGWRQWIRRIRVVVVLVVSMVASAASWSSATAIAIVVWVALRIDFRMILEGRRVVGVGIVGRRTVSMTSTSTTSNTGQISGVGA